MKKITEFKTICSSVSLCGINGLDVVVGELIKKGRQPYGNLVVESMNDKGNYCDSSYYQVMVKYEELKQTQN